MKDVDVTGGGAARSAEASVRARLPRSWRALACVAAAALAQCASPRTELVVTVRSELAWGEGRDLQSLVVTVRRGGPDGAVRWQQTKVLGAESGQWQIPLSFGLYPTDATDATPMWIEVLGCVPRDGCAANSALVVQRATVTYRPEEIVGLEMWLAARCRGVSCPPSETCARETGMCVPARTRDIDVRTLPGGVIPQATDAQITAPDAASDGARDASDDADAPDITQIDAPEAGADVPFDADVTAIDADATASDAGDVSPTDVGDAIPIDADAAITPDSPAIDVADVSPADVVDAPVDSPVTCAAPRMMCGGVCVDLTTSVANCGACGRACASGESCSAGTCASTGCPSGQSRCASGCLPTGASCVNGLGACAATGSIACGTNAAAEASVGFDLTCVRLQDRTVRCWGSNFDGALGDGTNTPRPTPGAVMNMTDCAEIHTGEYYACARRVGGAVACWGSGASGELGNGTSTDRYVPTAVMGITSARQISTGHTHVCALLVDGTVRCWGYNALGALGDGTVTTALTPVAVSGLSNVVQIAAGGYFTCALRSDRSIVCWGENLFGSLGDGSTTTRLTPVSVSGITTAVELVAGGAHACARLADGTVRCWGRNSTGQLGEGAGENYRSSPVVANGITGAVRVFAGGNSTCVILADATVRCWGLNNTGQLGDGSTTNRFTPVVMNGVSNARVVALGPVATCVTLLDGNVRCTGRNLYNQLGDGTGVSQTTATTVVNLTPGTMCSATTGAPAAETCNHIDDDCNGIVDDVLGVTCP